MSDVHFGKHTATFNPDTCVERLHHAGKALKRIHDLLGEYDLRELVVALAGDLNDGSGIYPTQAVHQSIGDPNEQAELLSEILANWALEQKQIWKHVRFEAVPGNHGRGGRFLHEAANWDLVAYEYLRLRLRSCGIEVNGSAKSNPFIHKFQIRGHSYLLYHGHGVRTYQGIPWYGIQQRVMKWSNTSLAPFDVALMGHFHVTQMISINRIRVLLSGTPITDDDWALQELGAESEPKWWFFGASDKRPLTWMFRIELDGNS